MNETNAALRAAGVVWRACNRCGIEWPFPTGLKLEGVIAPRVWECTVCSNDVVARLKRKGMLTE